MFRKELGLNASGKIVSYSLSVLSVVTSIRRIVMRRPVQIQELFFASKADLRGEDNSPASACGRREYSVDRRWGISQPWLNARQPPAQLPFLQA